MYLEIQENRQGGVDARKRTRGGCKDGKAVEYSNTTTLRRSMPALA